MNARTVQAACADEGFQIRTFTETNDTYPRQDWMCTCGWLQFSPRAGGRELLTCATWHDEEAKREFAALVDQQPDYMEVPQ